MHKKRCNSARTRSISIEFSTQKTMLNSTRKGQVTIFMILGLFLVLAVVLVVTLQKETTVITPEELSPEEQGSTQTLVSVCLETIGEDALEKIGLQGGYIDVPGNVINDPTSSLRLSSFLAIPFWAQGPQLTAPLIQDIEQRIDHYIEENLRECVFSQDQFLEVYDFVEKSDITSSTKAAAGKTIFNVEWALDVRSKDGETISELFAHVAESPIKLLDVHKTATAIIKRELAELKLEDLTQDLIALEHPKLPLAGFELSCAKKTWDTQEAEQTLKNLLRINLAQLQVKGTQVVEYPEQLPYYENHYVWNLGDETSKPDIDVSFRYNNYPFLFQVTPLQGGKMKSGTPTNPQQLPLLCMQQWKFTYDVVYPVLVQVRDLSTDYTFQFAFAVHLIRNTPNREVGFTPRISSQSQAVIDDGVYCSNKRTPMRVLTWELIDDQNAVYDQQPLERVDVSLTCLKYQCEIDSSEFNFQQSGYQAGGDWNFPHCVGGIVRGEREGYKQDWQRIVTESGAEVELNLAPLLELPADKIRVVKHSLEDGQVALEGQPLAEKETASVHIVFDKATPQTDITGEPFHEEHLVIGPSLDALDQQTLTLLAGADFTYSLEIRVFDDQKFIGGYAGNWTAPLNEIESILESSKQLTFHVVAKVDANDNELVSLLTSLAQLSESLPDPEVS